MSNSNIVNFEFESNSVRVVTIEGEPWFVAADVCKSLGLINPSMAIRPLNGGEKAVLRPGQPGSCDRNNLNPIYGVPNTLFGKYVSRINAVSESGLYKLILRSDKPQARRFQDWVTRDVLPAIRKDGAYIMGEEKVRTGELSEDELLLKAMQILHSKVERLTAERDQLAHVQAHRTVQQFCADRGLYLGQPFKSKLGWHAWEYCKENGIEYTTEPRILRKHGKVIESKVNRYPVNVLETVYDILKEVA